MDNRGDVDGRAGQDAAVAVFVVPEEDDDEGELELPPEPDAEPDDPEELDESVDVDDVDPLPELESVPFPESDEESDFAAPLSELDDDLESERESLR